MTNSPAVFPENLRAKLFGGPNETEQLREQTESQRAENRLSEGVVASKSNLTACKSNLYRRWSYLIYNTASKSKFMKFRIDDGSYLVYDDGIFQAMIHFSSLLFAITRIFALFFGISEGSSCEL